MGNLDGPEADDLKELGEVLKNQSLSKFKEIVANKRDEWEATEIKIGVTGQSGVGKSTFINTYRGMTPGRPTTGILAPVGERHTTIEATPYPDPRNSKIQLYDLPGLGAPGFGREKYLQHKNVNLQEYDLIIIITSERFREDDIWLYNKIHLDLGKPVFLVRNKTMIAVQQKMEREKMEENKALEKYKKECKEELQEHVEEMKKINVKYHNITHPIYFLDCHHKMHRDLDFSKLIIDCANDLSSKTPKHDAVILNIGLITPGILEKKYMTLKRWLPLAAARCSIDAALKQVTDKDNKDDKQVTDKDNKDDKVNYSLVKAQVDYYREQFGLDETTFNEVISDPTKRTVLSGEIISCWVSFALNSPKLHTAVATAITAVKAPVAASAIPLIGILVAQGIAFATAYYTLKTLLDEIYEDAKKIYIEPYQQ